MFNVKVSRLVKRDNIVSTAVIKVGVDCAFDDRQFLVGGVLAVTGHVLISVLAEIEAVRLVAERSSVFMSGDATYLG